MEMTGGMPCCGSTAPLQFPAAHIQSLAEDLAASLFMHFITGEYHYPGLRSDPFDMRYGNYCVGSPEYVLLDLAARKLFEGLFGRKRRWGYFLSMSKWPDRQAAHERTAGCWLQALAGAVHFRGSGQLSSDEIFSSEQVVIDRSIMRGAERLFRGLKWASSLDENLEVLEGGFRHGNFLEHPSTLVECREFYALRELFPATNLGQWNGSGRPTALGAAMNVVRQTLERNTFQRDPGEIRELRRTCTHGERGA
jgi:trimethylamine:corrinoid methyltransferase-like protein